MNDDERRYFTSYVESDYYEGVPIGIECRLVADTNMSWYDTGEIFRIPCVPEQGFWCVALDQDDGACEEYEVRYFLRNGEYQHYFIINRCVYGIQFTNLSGRVKRHCGEETT